MSRSKWKGPYLTKEGLKDQTQNPTLPRNILIPSTFLGKFINIHTGKELKKIFVSKEKVGLKSGTFAYTRRGKIKTKTSRKK